MNNNECGSPLVSSFHLKHCVLSHFWIVILLHSFNFCCPKLLSNIFLNSLLEFWTRLFWAHLLFYSEDGERGICWPLPSKCLYRHSLFWQTDVQLLWTLFLLFSYVVAILWVIHLPWSFCVYCVIFCSLNWIVSFFLGHIFAVCVLFLLYWLIISWEPWSSVLVYKETTMCRRFIVRVKTFSATITPWEAGSYSRGPLYGRLQRSLASQATAAPLCLNKLLISFS